MQCSEILKQHLHYQTNLSVCTKIKQNCSVNNSFLLNFALKFPLLQVSSLLHTFVHVMMVGKNSKLS